jgi:hypothetical protein
MQQRPALIIALLAALAAAPAHAEDPGRKAPSGTEMSVPPPQAIPRPASPEAYDYFDDPGVTSIPRPLGAGEVTALLQSRGFKDVAVIRQRGANFVAEATGKLGERVRLVVNGRTGGIDGARVIVPPRRRK